MSDRPGKWTVPGTARAMPSTAHLESGMCRGSGTTRLPVLRPGLGPPRGTCHIRVVPRRLILLKKLELSKFMRLLSFI